MADEKRSLQQMKQSLIAAGIDEKNLSEKDTISLYNAIVDSEKAAQSNGHSASDKEAPEIPTIFHKPKSEPPFYFNEKLRMLSLKQRKEVICELHYALHRKLYEAQRKSVHLVPWGRPISATTKEKFNGTLLKQEEADSEEQTNAIFESEEQQQPQQQDEEEEKKEDDVYVSQSGRQTKRKCYSDDAIMNFPAKKMKSPQNKYRGRKKLTNEDIMKRSSLFQDKPKTYTDKIFDELVSLNRKRQQEEEEMKRFEMTLDQVDADEDFLNGNDDKSSSTEEDPAFEEPPKRRRIVPPNPYKGKSSARKTTIDKQETQDSEVQVKINHNRTSPVDFNANVEKKVTGDLNSPQPSTSNGRMGRSRGGAKAKQQCPICGKVFDSEKVEAHAATCGEPIISDDDEPSILHRIRDTSTVSCGLCDRTFLMDEDYNNHVTNCVAEHTKKST